MQRQNAPRKDSLDWQQDLRQEKTSENKRSLRSSPSNSNKLKNQVDTNNKNNSSSITLSPTQRNTQHKDQEIIITRDSSVRLSRLNEEEAAIIFEDRRRQIFEKLTKQIKRSNSSSLNRSSSQRSSNHANILNYQNNCNYDNTPNQHGFKLNNPQNQSNSPSPSIRKHSTTTNNEIEHHMNSSQCSDNNKSITNYERQQRDKIVQQQQRSNSRNEQYKQALKKDKPSSTSTGNNNCAYQKNIEPTILKPFQQQNQPFQQQGQISVKQLQQNQQPYQSSQLQQSLRRSFYATQTTNNSNTNFPYSLVTQGSDIEQVDALKIAFLEAKEQKSKDCKRQNVNLMQNFYTPKSVSPKNCRNDDSIKKNKCSLVLVKCSSDIQESSQISPPQPLPLSLNTLSSLGKVVSTSITTLSPMKQDQMNKFAIQNIQQDKKKLRKQSHDEPVQPTVSLQNYCLPMKKQKSFSNSSQNSSSSSSSNSSIPSPEGKSSQLMTDNQPMIISGLPVSGKIPVTNNQNRSSLQIKQSPQQIPCNQKPIIDLQEQERQCNTNSNIIKISQNKLRNKDTTNEKYLYNTSQGFTISKLPSQTQRPESNCQSSTFNSTSTNPQPAYNLNNISDSPTKISKSSRTQQQRSISPASGYSTIMLPKAERSSVSQLKAQTHAMIMRNSIKLAENKQIKSEANTAKVEQQKQRLSNQPGCQQINQNQKQSGYIKGKQEKQLESSPYLSSTIGDQSSLNEEDIIQDNRYNQKKSLLNGQQSESKKSLKTTQISRSASERQRKNMTKSSDQLQNSDKRINSGKTVTSRVSQTTTMKTNIKGQNSDQPGYIEKVMIRMSENKIKDEQIKQEKSRDLSQNNYTKKKSSNRSQTPSPSTSCPQSGEKSPLKSILTNGKNSNYSPEKLPVMSFSKDCSARKEGQLEQQQQRRSEDIYNWKKNIKEKEKNISNNTESVLVDFRPKNLQIQSKSVAQITASQRAWQNYNNNNNKTNIESANLTSLIKQIIPLSNQAINHKDNSNKSKIQSDNSESSHYLAQQKIQCQEQSQQYQDHQKNQQKQVDSQQKPSGVNHTKGRQADDSIWIADSKLAEASQKLYSNYQLLILQAKQSHERMAQQNSAAITVADSSEETKKNPPAHKS